MSIHKLDLSAIPNLTTYPRTTDRQNRERPNTEQTGVSQPQHLGERLQLTIKRSQAFWDYHFIYWVFCLIFAFKDQSKCLSNTKLGEHLNFRQYLLIQGFTTLYLPLIYLFALIRNLCRDRECLSSCQCECEDRIFIWLLVPFYIFKFIWTIFIMQLFFFELKIADCNDLVIEFFVAYNIGLFLLIKELFKTCTAGDSSRMNRYLYEKQQEASENLQKSTLVKFMQEVSEKVTERRMIFALSTYLGLYLAINDSSKGLEGESPLRIWLIFQFSFQSLLPICTLISSGLNKFQVQARQCYKKGWRKCAAFICQRYSCTDFVKFLNQKGFYCEGTIHYYIMWDFLAFVLVIIGFIIILTYQFNELEDILVQYLAFDIVARFIYYSQFVLLRIGLAPPANKHFTQDFYEEIIKDLEERNNLIRNNRSPQIIIQDEKPSQDNKNKR